MKIETISNEKSTNLAPNSLSTQLSFIDDKSIAAAFYASGIFKDVKNEASALVKIIAGREQGLTPIEAMSSVYIIDDKIAYFTRVFLAKIKNSAKYNYVVKIQNEQICEIEFYENGKIIGASKFDFKDAARCGLANKDNFKKYPAMMLFYRAASKGIKVFCPDILNGANTYEDLIEVEPDASTPQPMTVNLETGEINEAKPMPQAQTENQTNEKTADEVIGDFFN
jgi:hypothetical protein